MKKIIGTFFLVGLFLGVSAQDATDVERRQLKITPTTEPIQIDGNLSEAIWQTAPSTTNFELNQPIDGELAKKQTVVQIIHDDRYVYIAAKMWDDPDYIHCVISLFIF